MAEPDWNFIRDVIRKNMDDIEMTLPELEARMGSNAKPCELEKFLSGSGPNFLSDRTMAAVKEALFLEDGDLQKPPPSTFLHMHSAKKYPAASSPSKQAYQALVRRELDDCFAPKKTQYITLTAEECDALGGEVRACIEETQHSIASVSRTLGVKEHILYNLTSSHWFDHKLQDKFLDLCELLSTQAPRGSMNPEEYLRDLLKGRTDNPENDADMLVKLNAIHKRALIPGSGGPTDSLNRL